MDIILYNIIAAIICLIFGYFCGSIPTAVWIGKIFFHKDVREFGSKNAGGTNAGRVFGKKIGVLVIALDIIKGFAPVWICWAILTFVPFGSKPLLASTYIYFNDKTELYKYIIQWPIYWLAGLGVCIGHCWPIFAQFKGGKGVACFASLMGNCWALIAGYLLVFFPLLKVKKFVSLSSITSAITTCVLSWIWSILLLCHVIPNEYSAIIMFGWTLNGNYVFSIVLTICAAILVIKHRPNIDRLKQGTERKITWMR